MGGTGREPAPPWSSLLLTPPPEERGGDGLEGTWWHSTWKELRWAEREAVGLEAGGLQHPQSRAAGERRPVCILRAAGSLGRC